MFYKNIWWKIPCVKSPISCQKPLYNPHLGKASFPNVIYCTCRHSVRKERCITVLLISLDVSFLLSVREVFFFSIVHIYTVPVKLNKYWSGDQGKDIKWENKTQKSRSRNTCRLMLKEWAKNSELVKGKITNQHDRRNTVRKRQQYIRMRVKSTE